MNLELLFSLITAIQPYFPYILTGFAFTAASITSIHVLLSRRAPGSSIAWIALVWLAPLLGVIAYIVFGVNRIRRRAEIIRPPHEIFQSPPVVDPIRPENLRPALRGDCLGLDALLPLANRVLSRPLLPGAKVKPLIDGDQAYPAMLTAIQEAKESVTLCTYIFDNDVLGQRFVKALANAHDRGVEVRVLIDAAGLRYSFPSIFGSLKKAKIPVAKFLPSLFPPHIMTLNLRNHRKILVVDGRIGFTGGINIRHYHLLEEQPKYPTRDLHFQVTGPVVAHIQEVFVDDWTFTTGEELRGPKYFPPLEEQGHTLARGIPDGPDENLDKLKWILLGAISTASKRVRIVTPYFIPDESMVSALTMAAMRGVDVEIVLPEKGNLPFVQWASTAHLGPLLQWGCQVFSSCPPFDHSKFVVIDDVWTLFGSANLDPRSLRLNFEFNIECWDTKLAKKLNRLIDERIETGSLLSYEEYENRSPIIRIRDGIASLASPYL